MAVLRYTRNSMLIILSCITLIIMQLQSEQQLLVNCANNDKQMLSVEGIQNIFIDLFDTNSDVEPVEPKEAYEKMELALLSIENLRRKRVKVNFGNDISKLYGLMQQIYSVYDEDDQCWDDKVLAQKRQLRDNYGSKYPALGAYLDFIVNLQLAPCTKQLEQSLAAKVSQTTPKICRLNALNRVANTDSRLIGNKKDSYKNLKLSRNNPIDPSSQVDGCEIDDLADLKREFKAINMEVKIERAYEDYNDLPRFIDDDDQRIEELEEPEDLLSGSPENKNVKFLKKLSVTIINYLNTHSNIPLEPVKPESWKEFRNKLSTFLEQTLLSKCRTNVAYFYPESNKFYDLVKTSTISENGVAQASNLKLMPMTTNWMETINLCRTLLKYNPVDLFLSQKWNIEDVYNDLFSRYVTESNLMDPEAAREKLELLVILSDAVNVVYGEKLYSLKHFDELLDVSDCQKNCERQCFKEMQKFGRIWKFSPNLEAIFIHDYERQFSKCTAQAKSHFESGLKKLLHQIPPTHAFNRASSASISTWNNKRSFKKLTTNDDNNFVRRNVAKAATDSHMSALDRLRQKIESVLPEKKAKYSIPVIRHFFANGIALYWKENRSLLPVLQRIRDTSRKFEVRLRNEVEPDCRHLEHLGMLEWNDDFGELSADEIKTNFGPQEDKWIVISNICRIILHENMGLEDAHLSVEGIV